MVNDASQAPPTPPAARPSGGWPETPWALVRRAREGDRDERRGAVDALATLYYRPVHAFFRRALRLDADAADDITQELFVTLVDGRLLGGVRHEESFRGFLRLCCRRRCARWRADARRRPLGGEAREGGASAAEPAADGEQARLVDAAFDDELRRFYVEEARAALRLELVRKGRTLTLAILEARAEVQPDGEPTSYKALAERFGVRLYDVRNHLVAARKVLRRHLHRLASERADDPRAELADLGLLGFVG